MPIYMIVKVYFVSEGISVATLKDIENMLKDLTKTELRKLLKRVDKELSGHPRDEVKVDNVHVSKGIIIAIVLFVVVLMLRRTGIVRISITHRNIFAMIANITLQ